jgi:tRNA (mo5U34)-methyltransferase
VAHAAGPSGDHERLHRHPFWYHTLELAPDLLTNGWFDLRPALAAIPLPDVRGKRCLDIGTYDGFFAFEMERRGAAQVVATDIEDHLSWDWPPDARPRGEADLTGVAFDGHRKGDGFRLAAEVLGSNVDWRPINVYDLDPAEIGTFDVVVCGSLLLHLRDPLRALEAIRRVCGGVFLSSEQIQPWLTVLAPHRPLARLSGSGPQCQWWTPNAAGHRQMLVAGGFVVEQASRPYVVRFNAHPRSPRTFVNTANTALRWMLTGTTAEGPIHRALLARPLPE